ncbi:MAG: ribonuclease HII [Acidobacteria bacterium]|nr:ribonuclease HII [Acidobacteriota bacterium]
MKPDGGIERRLRSEGFLLVAGVDEAGRGALAGPLVAAAVILPERYELRGLRDSKLLTPLSRARLDREIRRQALAVSVVRVTPGRIDRRGLHRSNLWALGRAVALLRPVPDYVLADGFRPSRLPAPALSSKKGDRVSASVAAASIVAKVARDGAMARLHRAYPRFGFDRNKGYGTAEHWRALRAHGPAPVHRLSFAGVAPGGTSTGVEGGWT